MNVRFLGLRIPGQETPAPVKKTFVAEGNPISGTGPCGVAGCTENHPNREVHNTAMDTFENTKAAPEETSPPMMEPRPKKEAHPSKKSSRPIFVPIIPNATNAAKAKPLETGHVHGPNCGHPSIHNTIAASTASAQPKQAETGHVHGPNCGHHHTHTTSAKPNKKKTIFQRIQKMIAVLWQGFMNDIKWLLRKTLKLKPA